MMKVALLLALFAIIQVPGIKAEGSQKKQPNFVWIFSDDQGYNDIGMRNPDIHSPTLDSLSEEGVSFTNQYVMQACSPSRHSLMTGRYPFASAMQHQVIFPVSPECSGLEYKFLPEYLKELGYGTHAVGKWHLGYCREECLPTSRGFDTFYGTLDGEGDYVKHESVGFYDWQTNGKLDYSVKGKHAQDLHTDALMDVIDQQTEEKPFFLYFAAQNPHTPLQPKEEDLKLYEDTDLSDTLKKYYALITGLDGMVKKIKDKLEEKDLMENTYLIFLADNGADVNIGSNEPFRGAKATLWEGGTKSTSFIYSPLLKKTGYVNDGLIHITDWFPTIINLAGGSVPDSEGIDGINQAAMLTEGQTSERKNMVYNIDMERQYDMPTSGQIAVRDERYKLLWGYPGQVDGYGMKAAFLYKVPEYIDFYNDLNKRTKRGRHNFSPENQEIMTTLIEEMTVSDDDVANGTGYMKLFDLIDDPSETTDLSTSEDPKHKEALEKLIAFVQNQIATKYKKYDNPNAKTFYFRIANPNRAFEPGWCEKLLPLPRK